VTASHPPADDPEVDAAYAAAVRRLVAEMSADPEATTELEPFAALLADVGRELIPSAECVITVVPPERQDMFVVVGTAGPLSPALVGSSWPVEGTLNWRAMAESLVVETNNAQQESSGLPPVFAAGGINVVRLVPLRTGSALVDGRVGLGVISWWRTGDTPYTDAERRRMDDVADLCSLFIRRIELGRAARRAVEAEAFKLREHADRMAGLEEVKTQFLNLASHELRGPLAVVQGYLSMMEDGSLKGRQLQAVLPTMSSKLRQMNMLVNEMLETARLEDERLTLTLREVGLVDAAKRVLDNSVALLGPNHRLETQFPAAEVVVRADPTRLDTIISNLVNNAVKYSPDGGLISVSVSQAGNLGRLTVRDEGFGIAESDMSRLFTRFGRLVTPENSHIPGTGLGLYLSRQLARMHGGDIAAASLVGKGSTFTVTVPLQEG
jgi:signal transduction histidine kinase